MPGVSHIDGPAVCGTRQDTIYQLWLEIRVEKYLGFHLFSSEMCLGAGMSMAFRVDYILSFYMDYKTNFWITA